MDTILKNGRIATVNPSFAFVEALAIADGKIIACGSNEEIFSRRTIATEVIDLQGKPVLPGAFDSHLHAAYAGLRLSPEFIVCEPEDAQNLEELNALIAEKTRGVPKDAWVIGWGFKQAGIREWARENRRPDWRDIEPGAAGHPVILNDGGLHTILVSKRALELAGVTSGTVFQPEQGRMYRLEDGSPSGLFTEFGVQAFIGKAAKHLNPEEMEACIQRMQRCLNRFGVTAHTDICGSGGDDICFGTFGEGAVEAYERLSRKGNLTARVFIDLFPGTDGVQSYDAIMNGLEQTALPDFQNRDWVRADAIKIFGDSGWQRDLPPEQNGYCMFPGNTEEEQAAEMKRTIVKLHRMGWQMGIHLTGGKGIDTAVEAFVEADQRFPNKDLRHFILHGSRMSVQNIQDCVAHKVELASQASGGYTFGFDADLKTPLSMGMHIAQGSDGPALPMDWIKGLHFLVTREDKDGRVVRPQAALSLPDAIRMYTINSAYQNHMEHRLGSLEPGKYADLQVLDRDLFSIDPKEIKDAKVVMTMVNGKIVYRQ